MNKFILCTTGTSIANGCPSLRHAQGHFTHWEDSLADLEKDLNEKLADPKNDYHDQAARRRLSAELNTLDRLNLSEGDRVVFLSTDSAPGRVCSEKLAQIITEVYDAETEAVRIEGLQVYDPKRLREEGLKNLVKVLLDDYLANESVRYSYDIIINPTGGYKAIVPFLTVLGMLYGKPAIYLFEHAEELITLPPLPLTFDLAIYERVKGALRFIEEETAVSEQAYLAHIRDYDPAEHDLFLSFTEPFDEGLLTLSPLASTLLKIEESGEVCMVSDEVRDTLKGLRAEKLIVIKRLINNASNPLWRHQKAHRWPGSKLLILKQGNTAERIAGFMEDNVFHVALAYASHDDYEKKLGSYTIEQLKAMQYAPWEIDKAAISEEELILQGTSDGEREKLLVQIRSLESELQKVRDKPVADDNTNLKEELELYRSEVGVLEEAKGQLERQTKKSAEEIAALREEAEQIRSQLEGCENKQSRTVEVLDGERREREEIRLKLNEMTLREGEKVQQISTLRKELSDRADEKKSREKVRKKLEKKINKVERELDKSLSLLQTCSGELEGVRRKNERMASKLDQNKQKRKADKKKTGELKKLLKAEKENLRKMKRENKHMQREKAKLQKALKKLHAACGGSKTTKKKKKWKKRQKKEK